jgi:acetylornithine/succinyldiaminopimelate/putrescine aminotransferase
VSDIPAREAKVYMQAARRLPVTIVRGQNSRVWDDGGKEYIDFVAGIAVVSLGHANAGLAETVASIPSPRSNWPSCSHSTRH